MRKIAIATPDMGGEKWHALREPLMSRWLTQGPKVAAFEKAFAERHRVNQAVALTSATTRLHLRDGDARHRPWRQGDPASVHLGIDSHEDARAPLAAFSKAAPPAGLARLASSSFIPENQWGLGKAAC